MNVKPGDLAIVIIGQSSGKICKVICIGQIYSDHWRCSFPSPVECLIGKSTEAMVPDAWLRPISGLPLQEDEKTDIKVEI